MLKLPDKLIVKSKHSDKQSTLSYITIDGWVVTEDGGYGDNEIDCTIHLDMTKELKELRIKKRMSQKEMGWMLGVSRTTYINIESGARDLTLKEYIIINHLKLDI